MIRAVRAEKAVLLGFWGLAALGCLIGLVHAPSESIEPGTGREIGDLVRVLCTTALAITLLLGPGLLWRPLTERKIGLGFVPLPGFAILVVAGGLVWVLVDPLGQQAAAFLVLGPVLGLMLGALLSVEEDLLSAEERRTLLIVGIPLGIAIARSIWSYGPGGELFEATVSRSLNPEPRSDSRTSYLVAMLVATGQRPYHVTEGLNFFAPYNFSARGPLPGMMSAPLMLLEGAKTKLYGYEAPWMPFDAQGFTVYRIAIMTFGATAYLSCWQLVRTLAGARAARFALVLAVSTPFLIDDLWFTWPKLMAASFVILAAVFMVERKSFRSGLMVSLGYLMHGDLTIAQPELTRGQDPENTSGVEVTVPNPGDEVALPRGRFLYVGGDTAYPVADTELIRKRFTKPMNDALEQRFLGENNPPKRPILGIPGNHDWYDSLDGFNRTFRKRPEPSVEPPAGSTPTTTPEGYEPLQQASYFALKLPGGWGLWAIDARDGADIDYRQRCFFAAAGMPTKLILATPNPAFVNGYPAHWYRQFWQGLPARGRSRLALWFFGDTHHYARYAGLHLGGPAFTSLVSGLGGAALHAPQRTEPGKGTKADKIYPEIQDGERAVMRRLVCPWIMTKHWGLVVLGVILGFVLGAGTSQGEGEATFLINVVAPTLVSGKPQWPVLLPAMATTLGLAILLFLKKRKDRATRERDVRQMSGLGRLVGAGWPILALVVVMVLLAHCRHTSFLDMVSDFGFHLVLLILLLAFPGFYAWNVAEYRKNVFFYAVSAALALFFGAAVVAGSVLVAAKWPLPLGFLGPAASAAALQLITFASVAGVIFASGFKLGTHRMASSSFAAVDKYLAFIRFRLSVDKEGVSTLTGFVIAVSDPVPRAVLNGADPHNRGLVPKARLIDVFTVRKNDKHEDFGSNPTLI